MTNKKQLNFTDSEKTIIVDSTKAVLEILLHKMDNGCKAPTITGRVYVENENREFIFKFSAQSLE